MCIRAILCCPNNLLLLNTKQAQTRRKYYLLLNMQILAKTILKVSQESKQVKYYNALHNNVYEDQANVLPSTTDTMISIFSNQNAPFRPPFELFVTINIHQTCKLILVLSKFKTVFVGRNIMTDLCYAQAFAAIVIPISWHSQCKQQISQEKKKTPYLGFSESNSEN